MDSQYQAKWLKELEDLIRSGRSSRVRQELMKVNHNKIPRTMISRFSNIASRVGLANLAIKTLKPIVRSEKTQILEPKFDEIAEYIFALNRLGMVNEALQVYSENSQIPYPKIHLYAAYCHVVNWDNHSAIQMYRTYLADNPDSEYQNNVVKLNLASSLFSVSEFSEAESIVLELIGHFENQGHQMLFGNALELYGQNLFFKGEFAKAQEYLNRALDQALDEQLIYKFFCKKWLCFIECEKIKSRLERGDQLKFLRKQASELHHWESIREVDLYSAKYLQSQSMFESVYFGTPSNLYRKRCIELSGFEVPSQTDQSFILSPQKDANLTDVLDLKLGKYDQRNELLKGDSILLRTLQILTRDFYRPMSVGSIFGRLYPGEFYDPMSSPNRIYQAIKSLREYNKKRNLGWSVDDYDGHYLLQVKGETGIRKYLGYSLGSHFENLKAQYGENLFSAKQAADTLGISLSSATRVLNKEIKEAKLVREKIENRTKYKIVA